jgi:hypothetical protein
MTLFDREQLIDVDMDYQAVAVLRKLHRIARR